MNPKTWPLIFNLICYFSTLARSRAWTSAAMTSATSLTSPTGRSVVCMFAIVEVMVEMRTLFLTRCSLQYLSGLQLLDLQQRALVLLGRSNNNLQVRVSWHLYWLKFAERLRCWRHDRVLRLLLRQQGLSHSTNHSSHHSVRKLFKQFRQQDFFANKLMN